VEGLEEYIFMLNFPSIVPQPAPFYH